jgi:hypothetical protein
VAGGCPAEPAPAYARSVFDNPRERRRPSRATCVLELGVAGERSEAATKAYAAWLGAPNVGLTPSTGETTDARRARAVYGIRLGPFARILTVPELSGCALPGA